MIQTHLGPWQKTKAFLNFLWFHWDIQITKKLLSVHPDSVVWTMQIVKSNFTVNILPQSQASRWASYRRVKLHGEHPTTESGFTVSILPQNQASRWASYRRVKLHSEHPTAESSLWCASHGRVKLVVCILPQSQAPRCAFHRRVELHGVQHTTNISRKSKPN